MSSAFACLTVMLLAFVVIKGPSGDNDPYQRPPPVALSFVWLLAMSVLATATCLLLKGWP